MTGRCWAWSGGRAQASERRAAACELLVSRYQGLVRSCVRPYLRSPEPAEDLMQVGYIPRTYALDYLRSRLLDLEGTSAANGPCAATLAHPVRKVPGPVVC